MAETDSSEARACVIIPTYNEAENIQPLIETIRSGTDCARVHIVVVDDGSADGTGERVRRMAERMDGLELIARPGKRGLGTAYVAGFRRAFDVGAAFAITMDADFSHDPAKIPELLGAMDNPEADVAIGSRYVAGGRTARWGLHRKLLSRTANWLAHTLLRLRARDCTSGFRCYRVSFLRSLNLDAIKTDGYSYLVELLTMCQGRGARIVEIPIVFRNRERGRSKISRTEIFKAVATLCRLWRKGRS